MELTISTPRVFKPLLKPSRYKGAYGGRASGKSHFFAEMAVEYAILNPGARGVCIREVQKSLSESAKLLIEDKIERFGVQSQFRVQTDRILTPGDGIIIFRGMQDYNAESIKSLENFNWAWNEEAQTTSQRSLELLRPTIRAPKSELWFSWNPRNPEDPVDKFFREGTPPPKSVLVHCNWDDNPFFPPEMETEREFDEENNPLRYDHIWNGEYEPAVVGAIWSLRNIHQYRRHEIPPMRRIVVSIDPAVSSEPGSDEHGIIACGIGEDQRGYLLADESMKGKPDEWAMRAIGLYDTLEADAIVVERNNGGDMIRHTLETVRPGLPIIEVVATRGKHVRAEPIAALYSAGRISHIGTYPRLESQMCQFSSAGYEGHGSPDRVDAAVWGFTELFPAIVTKKQRRAAEIPANHLSMGVV